MRCLLPRFLLLYIKRISDNFLSPDKKECLMKFLLGEQIHTTDIRNILIVTFRYVLFGHWDKMQMDVLQRAFLQMLFGRCALQQMRTFVDVHFSRCAFWQIQFWQMGILVDRHYGRWAVLQRVFQQINIFVEGCLVDDHFVEGCLVDGHFCRGSFCRCAFLQRVILQTRIFVEGHFVDAHFCKGSFCRCTFLQRVILQMRIFVEGHFVWPPALVFAGGSVLSLRLCASFYYIPTPNGALGGKKNCASTK